MFKSIFKNVVSNFIVYLVTSIGLAIAGLLYGLIPVTVFFMIQLIVMILPLAALFWMLHKVFKSNYAAMVLMALNCVAYATVAPLALSISIELVVAYWLISIVFTHAIIVLVTIVTFKKAQ